MKVAFDARPVTDTRGIGRYARCLLSALRATAGEQMEVVENHRPRGRQFDVFHSPWMQGAMLRSPCPMIVTLHDLAALKRRSELLRAGASMRLRHLAVQRAVRVVVPTKTVAEDAMERLGVEAERLVVIPEAPDSAMFPRTPSQVADVRERFSLPERYFVWVGGLEHPDPHKQVAQLAATPRELPLVLVGPTNPWAHELPDVTLTGRVSDEDLARIYSGAHALVVPSEEEGFGLPAVEALACGTPVVACDCAALREVLQKRATFVEQGDLESLTAAALQAARPAPRPPEWTWDDAARRTWAVYEEALDEAKGGWKLLLRPQRDLSRPRGLSRPRAAPTRPESSSAGS